MRLKILEGIVLTLILLLAGWLRCFHLSDNPGWFADESVHLIIADHLRAGHIQFMAVTDSTLFFARQPLFEILLAGIISIFGKSMLTLRGLSAGLSLMSIIGLWAVLRKLTVYPGANWQTRLLPITAAGLLAIYPQAVIYGRFGFSYHLLTLFVLGVLLGLGEYIKTGQRGGLFLAAICIGVGGTSDLMMFSFALPLILITLYLRWRDLRWNLPLIALPMLIYATLMLNRAPNAFLFDAHFTAGRLSGLPIQQQIYNTTHNYTALITQDVWIVAGMIGLWLIRPKWLMGVVGLLWLVPIFMLGRIVALYSLSAYYMIPFMPFAAIGVAALIIYGVPQVFTDFYHRVGLLPLVLIPLLVSTELTIQQVKNHLPTAIDPFLVPAQDAEQVAAYLNQVSQPDDVVIVSPAIGWQLNANTVDFSMGSAILEGDFYWVWGDVQMPRERFHHAPGYTEARFVVVDPLWQHWGVQNAAGIAEMLARIEHSWKLVYQSNVIKVYENPTHP